MFKARLLGNKPLGKNEGDTAGESQAMTLKGRGTMERNITDRNASVKDRLDGGTPLRRVAQPVDHHSAAAQLLIHDMVYFELSENPVVQKDALTQLRSNIELLEDLQARFGFMMREISGLVRPITRG